MLTRRVKNAFEENNGILSLSLAEEKGLSKETLRKAYLRGDLVKDSRGIYLLDESNADDMYSLQLRFSTGIFSHETAVMLHGLSTYSPFVYHLTFPRGYHLKNAKDYNIYSHHMVKEKYNYGIVLMESWHGNNLIVTDLERTVIDMLKANRTMPGVEEEMLENYFWMEERNINRLKSYARFWGVESEVEEKVMIYAQ